jgi:hypothetical protein
MTTATITFTDDDSSELNLSIDFGEDGINQDSMAHLAAAKAYVEIAQFLKTATADDNNESSE